MEIGKGELTMNNVVYMTEDQERSNRLEVESNLANLFRERVETKGKQVRSLCRNIALWVTLGVSTWFLADMGLKLYEQQLMNSTYTIRFLISALNLLVFLGGFSVMYFTMYHLSHTLVGFRLFNRGEYYERKDSTHLPLFDKIERGYYTDMYFQSNGNISKVSVPNHYANRFELGASVPVDVAILMYKQSGRVRLVTNCVGSRANNEQEFQETLWRHNGNLKAPQKAYQQALTGSVSTPQKQIGIN